MAKDEMKKGKDSEEEKEPVDNATEEGAESSIEGDVQAAIQPCLDRIKAGEYASKDEAIDALIADLEAAKTSEPAMGGLGMNEGMALPEEEGGVA